MHAGFSNALDWESWRTLLAVARHGSLARAAAQIGVDPTTAGRRIKRLEKMLGKRLLEREGTRLVPTPHCVKLIEHLDAAEAALLQAAGISEAATGPAMRKLRITAVPYVCEYLLAPRLGALVEGRKLAVELIADNRNSNLTRREADLALRLARPPDARPGAIHLGDIPYSVFARAGAATSALPWASLDDAYSHLPEARWVRKQAGPGGIRYKASQLSTLKEVAAQGIARVLLPAFIGAGDARLGLVGGTTGVSRPLWLLHNPGDGERAEIGWARDWIGETVRPHLN